MSITDLRCKVHRCRINLYTYTYGLSSTNMAKNIMKMYTYLHCSFSFGERVELGKNQIDKMKKCCLVLG